MDVASKSVGRYRECVVARLNEISGTEAVAAQYEQGLPHAVPLLVVTPVRPKQLA
jgi:hypothetical protein